VHFWIALMRIVAKRDRSTISTNNSVACNRRHRVLPWIHLTSAGAGGTGKVSETHTVLGQGSSYCSVDAWAKNRSKQTITCYKFRQPISATIITSRHCMQFLFYCNFTASLLLKWFNNGLIILHTARIVSYLNRRCLGIG
jgi:hypothetical protein